MRNESEGRLNEQPNLLECGFPEKVEEISDPEEALRDLENTLEQIAEVADDIVKSLEAMDDDPIGWWRRVGKDASVEFYKERIKQKRTLPSEN